MTKITVRSELERLAAKAILPSMVCFGKYARVIESTEKAFLVKSKDSYTVVYLINGRIESDIFRDEESATCRFLTVA